ncbi:hypothetical protein MTO96_045995 [Rhipicephalus appendiculatus]
MSVKGSVDSRHDKKLSTPSSPEPQKEKVAPSVTTPLAEKHTDKKTDKAGHKVAGASRSRDHLQSPEGSRNPHASGTQETASPSRSGKVSNSAPKKQRSRHVAPSPGPESTSAVVVLPEKPGEARDSVCSRCAWRVVGLHELSLLPSRSSLTTSTWCQNRCYQWTSASSHHPIVERRKRESAGELLPTRILSELKQSDLLMSEAIASFVIQLPDAFNFSSPNEWPKWKKRFERFRTSSGLCVKPEQHQVDALLYIMGEQAEEIYATFALSEKNSKKFDAFVEQFDKYFIPRRNVIFERARFNTRVPQDGESAEDVVTALHTLSKDCEYGALREEFVRDRLVVGIKDKQLSARLQLDADLTLQKALDSVRQIELSVNNKRSFTRRCHL